MGLTALCFFLLSLYYVKVVVPEFGYMGYAFKPSFLRIIVTGGLFMILFGLSVILLNNEAFLFSIFVLLVFFFFIPNAILFSFGHTEIRIIIANTLFLLIFPLSGWIRFRIPYIKKFRKENAAVLILMAFLPFVWIVWKTWPALNLNTLLLKEIYETREIFSRHISGLSNYSFHLLSKCLLPVAIVLSLTEKRYRLSLIPVSMLLFLYLVSGNKLVYFTTLIVLFFYFTGTTFIGKVNGFLLMMILLMAIFPFIDYLILKEPVMAGTFINRMLFIPALLNQFYFDFFNGQPLWFAESNLFSWFVHSPFDKPAGYVLIEHFWNEEGVYGNNGLVSDGYMNAGWLGIILFSVCFSILFSFLNSLALHRSYFGVYFSFVFVILSSSFLSVFITGGLLFFIFLAVIVLRHGPALSDKKIHPA